MAEAGSMAQLNEAFKMLKKEDVKKLELHGEPGVGKTWMARMLSHRAMKEKLFDLTLWLSLNPTHNFPSLHERIARQIPPFPACFDWKLEAAVESSTELKDRDAMGEVSEALAEKKVLFIMEVDEEMADHDGVIFQELNKMVHPDKQAFIIVRTGERDVDVPGLTGIRRRMEVQCLSEDESTHLVEEVVGKKLGDFPRIKKLATYFLNKSKRMPYEVMVIGKSLRHLEQKESGLRMLEDVMEENADHFNVLNLLGYGDGIFPKNVMMDCCCVGIGNKFVRKRGNVYYNELINYWILEGYIGKFDSMEDAYNVGHSVLMELIDCGLIRQLETNCISFMSEANAGYQASRVDYMNYVESTKLGLGFADVLDGDLGRTAVAEGIIKGGMGAYGENKLSTLILDLDHLNNEVLNETEFWSFRHDLQVLAIFYPEFHLFPLTSDVMRKLRLLVLRGCEFDHLKSFEQILNSPPMHFGLTVLEISGPNMSLQSLPDDLFNNMSLVKSLNLSFLQIKSLPSLRALKSLVWLILRQCTQLEELQSLKTCRKLQVLDLSGSSSLRIIHDSSLSSNKALRILNLSESQIGNLPLLRGLSKLTHLLLRDCIHLERVRKITALSSLQILDLSGCTRFQEFADPSFAELRQLQVLDVSRTIVDILPLDITRLCEFKANGCTKLKELPFPQPIQGLEVLDLSGSCSFKHIPDGFFSQLKSLKELNLSNTDITNIPAISDLHSLRILSLSHCPVLESLGELQSTQKLEVFDLSGCESLREIQGKSLQGMIRLRKLDLSGTKIAHLPQLPSSELTHVILKNCSNLEDFPSFAHPSSLQELNLSGAISIKSVDPHLEHMTNLHFLDLSETRIESLPSLSKLKNLKNLSLRDCHSLTVIPGFEALSNLNVLDLSGTSVKDLPSLKNFGSLKRLLLRGCSGLEKFQKLEILEALSCYNQKELPYDISTLASLEQLEPPVSGGNNSTEIGEWSISNWPKQAVKRNGLTITLSSVEIRQFLQENPTIWETGHFLVHPADAFGKFGDKRYYEYELFLRDIYFRTEISSKCLDIRGFNVFPESLGLLLDHAEFVVLVDNPFLTSLSVFKKQKGCWIERCNEIENADCLEMEMEILRVSHAPKLKNMHSLRSLKSLFLEHCPEIIAISPDSDHLKSLEILEIRFCDKIESLSGSFPKLKTLKLWWLPELRNLSTCVLTDDVETLEILRVSHAPKLKNMHSLRSLKSLFLEHCPEIIAIGPDSDHLKSLEILEIRFCDKIESISGSFPKLKTLKLWWLPELRNLSTCVLTDDVETLEILRVSHAPKLKNMHSLRSLKSLFLEHCPEIIAISPDSDHLKSLEILEIRFCDKIESLSGSFPKLKTLKLWWLPELRNLSTCVLTDDVETLEIGECPMIVEGFSWTGCFPKALKCLKIKFCDRLRAVFEPSSVRIMSSLQRLCLWDLPEIMDIGLWMPQYMQERVIYGCSKLEEN